MTIGSPRAFKRSDYDATYNIPRNVMARLYIQLTQDLSPTDSRRWLNVFIFEFANVAVALSLEILATLVTARGASSDDALAIVRMLPCITYTILSLMKASKMMHCRQLYVNIINELGDMWPETELDEEEYIILRDALKQLHFVVKGFDKCHDCLLVGFLWTAFFEYFKARFGYDGQIMVHFIYWLPFDPLKLYVIEFMLLLQSWHACIVIWVNLCADLIFCIFISHITTQFDLLSIKIKKMFYVPTDEQLIRSYPLSGYCTEYKETEEENIFKHNEKQNNREKQLIDKFRFIFHRHRDLIRICKEIESLFSFIFLVNFINSSILICFCGFCCIAVERWNEAGYKIFLLTVLFQTYLICWYGQKLIDASKGISAALYNCGWYTAPKSLRAPILIILIRCQRDVAVTTYGFSIICLSSYTQIIKTAWSYFTLLLKTYDP